MNAQNLNGLSPGLSPEAIQRLSADPNALALIKAYLDIPDEVVRKKLRRLAEEIAVPAKRMTKTV